VVNTAAVAVPAIKPMSRIENEGDASRTNRRVTAQPVMLSRMKTPAA